MSTEAEGVRADVSCVEAEVAFINQLNIEPENVTHPYENVSREEISEEERNKLTEHEAAAKETQHAAGRFKLEEFHKQRQQEIEERRIRNRRPTAQETNDVPQPVGAAAMPSKQMLEKMLSNPSFLGSLLPGLAGAFPMGLGPNALSGSMFAAPSVNPSPSPLTLLICEKGKTTFKRIELIPEDCLSNLESKILQKFSSVRGTVRNIQVESLIKLPDIEIADDSDVRILKEGDRLEVHFRERMSDGLSIESASPDPSLCNNTLSNHA